MRTAKAVKSKKTLNASALAMVRSITPDFYGKLLHGKYKDFTGKYKLETFNKVDDIIEMKDIIEFIRKDINAPIPESTPVTIHMGIYTRTASTYIDPPSERCGIRVLFNLGADETYELQGVYKHNEKTVDSGLESKAQYMKANTYCVLGPYTMCNYKIHVDQDIYVQIPQINPTKAPESPKPRPSNYKRITIVLDYNLESEELLDQLTNLAMNNTPKIKATPGMSQKKINEQIDIAKKKLINLPNSVEPKEKSDLEKMMAEIADS